MMINFTRAFDSAWERMMIILFRPFDFGKWFVIGFSAFLAGFLEGGNGASGGNFNNLGNLNQPSSHSTSSVTTPNLNDELHKFNTSISHAFTGLQAGVIVVIALVVVVLVLLLTVLFLWLGTRGQFLFLDNIVRNRGAIAWPWQQYSRQANSLFWLDLLFMVISIVIVIPLIVIAVVMAIPLFQQNRWPAGGEIAGFIVLFLLYLAFMIVFTFVLFIFRSFGIPLMFRNGLMARPAFIQSMGLIRLHPGSILLFTLLRFALSIGVWVVSVVACCACCIGVIPYIGTVAILPALIYVRCFTLDCLAQFGPEYDVWTVDVAPGSLLSTPPASPQLPLG